MVSEQSEQPVKQREYRDPVTGDALTTGEWVSWQIQGIFRHWIVLGSILFVTALAWATNNTAVLVWWNLSASLLAIVIEFIVGKSMLGQTKRDAVVTREIRTLAQHIAQIAEVILRDVEQGEHGEMPSASPDRRYVMPEHTAPSAQTTLYTHTPHPHTPRNANAIHQAEQAHGSFNDRLSVAITKATATMWCAYVFTFIGITSLVALFTGNLALGLLFGGVSSYFLQLVMLPVIQNGTAVLSRHQEIQADEMYHGIVRMLHENDQNMQHLNAQDAELVKQTHMLTQLLSVAPPASAASPVPAPVWVRPRNARGQFTKKEIAA